MSFLSRLWNIVRRPVRFVGKDLEGNSFYEQYSPNNPTRPKRTVQYHNPDDVWKYIGGGKRLPVQWSAWLSYTRNHPPTFEELQKDFVRQQRLAANVALIEARDRREDEERLKIRQEDARRALEIASQKTHNRPQISTFPAGDLPGSETHLESKPPANDSGNSIQHPPFVTPAIPRKPKPSSSQLARPPLTTLLQSGDIPINFEERSMVDEKAQALPTGSVGGTPLYPKMPSRPSVDTESWSPQARRRG